MKWYVLAFCLAACSATVRAQQPDPCAGLAGSALGQCQADQQALQREQLAQQRQQLAHQQEQLTQQQQQLTQQQQQLAQQLQMLTQQQQQLTRQQEQLVQQHHQLQQQQGQNRLNDLQPQLQSEATRRSNDVPGKPSENERAAMQAARQPTTASSRRQELKSWKVENPWYGSDYARTQFAMRYAKQLQQEQPDLVGRPFLDAISAKVKDTFGATK